MSRMSTIMYVSKEMHGTFQATFIVYLAGSVSLIVSKNRIAAVSVISYIEIKLKQFDLV